MIVRALALVVDGVEWCCSRGLFAFANPGHAQARKLERRQGAVAIFEATADQRGSWATLTGEAHRGQARLLR